MLRSRLRCSYHGLVLRQKIISTGLIFRWAYLNPHLLQPRDTHTRTFATIQHDVRQRQKDILATPDTIYALSTAPGRAAIAVIRVSGPACLDIYGGLCPSRPFPHPRIATLRKLYDPQTSDNGKPRVLDNGALVLYFPAPKTVTGEDILELHVHGGPAIIRSVLEAIPKCINARPRRRSGEFSHIRHAEPGEFTKRAFYNGRLDLTQAEALGETLAAETEQQRRLAINGATNGLSKRYEEWRRMLLYARGELEALIDFSEDQHFDESPSQFMASVTKQVLAIQKQIELHLKNASRGELLRNGISIALLGAPNAGKSSLLNRIVGREAAIVSAEEGTTRDIVDVSVDIGGWLCRLGDMAGLRASMNSSGNTAKSTQVGLVEKEGIRRARERALQSDVVIVLLSIEKTTNGDVKIPINTEVLSAVKECEEAGKTILLVINKADVISERNDPDLLSSLLSTVRFNFPNIPTHRQFLISCLATDLSTSSPYTSSPSFFSNSDTDPGSIQSFLTGLTTTFGEMTSAQQSLDDPSIATSISTPTMTPTEAQSYWTASLSITHRQSAYLKDCLFHLNDFIDQAFPRSSLPHTVSNSGSPSTITPQQASTNRDWSHHIDNHDDLVGEIDHLVTTPNMPTIASHETMDLEADVDIVTAAEHLRYAALCLAKITGRGDGGDVEDVLGVVFEK